MQRWLSASRFKLISLLLGLAVLGASGCGGEAGLVVGPPTPVPTPTAVTMGLRAPVPSGRGRERVLPGRRNLQGQRSSGYC